MTIQGLIWTTVAEPTTCRAWMTCCSIQDGHPEHCWRCGRLRSEHASEILWCRHPDGSQHWAIRPMPAAPGEREERR